MIDINGSCHCKNIQYTFTWPTNDKNIPIRACSCTFCTRIEGKYTSHPDAKLRVNIDNPSNILKYNFGTKTADFYTCSTCGIMPFITSEINNHLYAVVNINTFQDFDKSLFTESISNFDSETIGGRLDRRQNRWIKDIKIF